MTELPTATAPVVPKRRSVWHVLASITLATNIALLALLVIFGIQVDRELSGPPARDNDGLARLGVIVIVGVPAICLAAVAFVALVSILSRQRSVMIAATILGALVTVPIAIVASWMLYGQVTMPAF